MKPAKKPAPSHADRYQKAAQLYAGGSFAEALDALTPLLAPAAGALRADALNLAAACSLPLQRSADAERYWRAALKARPNYPEVLNNLGVILKSTGRTDEAEASFRRALALCPDYAEAHNGLGALLHEVKRHEEAVAACRRALELAPAHPEALHNLSLALFALGRLDEAEAASRDLLAQRPGHATALVHLGNVLAALHRLPEAEQAHRAAIAAQPGLAEAHYNLAVVINLQGRAAEAEAPCRQAIALRPDYAEALFHLGVLCHTLERDEEAEALYRQVIALCPDIVEPRQQLGALCQKLGRETEAETLYREIIAQHPDFVDAHVNLAALQQSRGQTGEAEALYRRAIELDPENGEAHNNLGAMLCALKRLTEAEAACRKAIELRPDYAEAHNNLAVVLQDAKRFEESEQAYREAVRLCPHYSDAWHNLGALLKEMHRYDEAEAIYRHALTLRPDFTKVHNNLGVLLLDADRPLESVEALRTAIALDPGYDMAHNNLGIALKELGHFEEAEAAYRRALELNPEYADARVNAAILQLHLGRFETGWAGYEARSDKRMALCNSPAPEVDFPQWRGETLQGKSILVWYEQGSGDMIQFGRYLPMLKRHGAVRVTLACDRALHALMSGVESVDAVVDGPTARARGGFDYWIQIMSLPLRFGTMSEDAIPDAVYLKPDPQRMAYWRERLAGLPGRKVGLVWKGNPTHRNDRNRSLPSLATLAALWKVPGVSFVSLQKGPGEDEAKAPPAGQPILHLGSGIRDFADSAAITAQLDLVICVDTAAAHLAGSLGKPTWVLLPAHGLDWRWQSTRTDSPWYRGTMQLFRQATHGNWAPTIEAMAEQLRTGVPAERPAPARAVQPSQAVVPSPTPQPAAPVQRTEPARYLSSLPPVPPLQLGPLTPARQTQRTPVLQAAQPAQLAQLLQAVQRPLHAESKPSAPALQAAQSPQLAQLIQAVQQRTPAQAASTPRAEPAAVPGQVAPRQPAPSAQAGALLPAVSDAPAPDFARVYEAAFAHYSGGRFAEALAALTALFGGAATAEQRADALNLAAACSLSLGRAGDAESFWRRALEATPHNAQVHNNLAALFKQLGRLDEAEAACRAALALRPDYAEAHNSLGSLLYDLKRLPEAEAACRQALALNPRHVEAHYNLGVVLQGLERLNEAEAAYRMALQLRPAHAATYSNLGNTLSDLGRLPEAEAAFRQALALDPNLTEAYSNLGIVLKDLGRVAEAEAAYRAALRLDPSYCDARFNLAGLLLSEGRFAEGWPLYEARYDARLSRRTSFPPSLACPQWQGEPIAGKRLLVWHEQGYGDVIQFARYLPVLKAQTGAHILVGCAQQLRPLFEQHPAVDAVIDDEAALPALHPDFWMLMMSAPLRTAAAHPGIPDAAWLTPDPRRADYWRTRLAPLAGRKIGLVWKGSAAHRNDANRSLPSLDTLAPLWDIPGVSFVSLQKGQGEDEAIACARHRPLLHVGEALQDFADSAAVIAQLDLVICVDTAAAHLAGALGKPCWVLLPAISTDWRWMNAGDTSPWYPDTLRLFRQTRAGDWGSVVARVREACLEAWPAAELAGA